MDNAFDAFALYQSHYTSCNDNHFTSVATLVQSNNFNNNAVTVRVKNRLINRPDEYLNNLRNHLRALYVRKDCQL